VTTEGLDAILEHEAGDLTCTVESGIRLSTLNAALARHGQRLSLDPPGDPTVGALLARNVSGPLRHRFGAPRDLVLGVTLVLADGTITSAGGKVVKNVAGYDLARLVCGSHGRLALIGRASFRLHPVPRATRTLVLRTDEPARAVFDVNYRDIDLNALTAFYQMRGLQIAGRASGHNEMSWPLGRFAERAGSGSATFESIGGLQGPQLLPDAAADTRDRYLIAGPFSTHTPLAPVAVAALPAAAGAGAGTATGDAPYAPGEPSTAGRDPSTAARPSPLLW